MPAPRRFEERVVIVTGGSSGIGLATALRFGKEGARVVIAALQADESRAAAEQAGLVSFTNSAAIEGKAKGIRVNAILPGAVDTPMLWENPNLKSGLETINTADVGKPEDIAAAIAFLASDEAKLVEGAALRVDGGRLSRL